MRHFVTLVVWLLVCAACKAIEPQKIAVNNVTMSFYTDIEQNHRLYGAGDFVAKTEVGDCAPMKVFHSISVRLGKLTIDADEDTEAIYKINSCKYVAGSVFKDRGTQDIYTLSCSDDDGGLATICISKVKDGNRSQTIVSIISYDKYGVPANITTLHD